MFPPKSPRTPRTKSKKGRPTNTRPKLRFGGEGSVQKPSALQKLFDSANASTDLSNFRRSASRTEPLSRTGRNTQRVSVRKQRTLKRSGSKAAGNHLKALNTPGKDQSFFELDPKVPNIAKGTKPKRKEGSLTSDKSHLSKKRGVLGRLMPSFMSGPLSRTRRNDNKGSKLNASTSNFASKSMMFRFAKKQKEEKKFPKDYDPSKIENQVNESAINLFAIGDELSVKERKKFKLLKKNKNIRKNRNSFVEEEEEDIDFFMKIGSKGNNEASNFLPTALGLDDISLDTSDDEEEEENREVSVDREFALEDELDEDTVVTDKSESSTINTLSSTETEEEVEQVVSRAKTSSGSRKFSSKNDVIGRTEVSDSTSTYDDLDTLSDEDEGFGIGNQVEEFDELVTGLLDATVDFDEEEKRLSANDIYMNEKKPSAETSIATSALIYKEDESDLAYCRDTEGITTRNVDTIGMTLNCGEDISLYETQKDSESFHPQHQRRDSATVYGVETMKINTRGQTTKHQPKQYNYHYEKKHRGKVLKMKLVTPVAVESETIRELNKLEADNLEEQPLKEKKNDKKVRFASAVKEEKEQEGDQEEYEERVIARTRKEFTVRQRAAKSMSREEAADWARRFMSKEAKIVKDPRVFFKVDRVIGSGSFGTVRKCRDLDTNQLVAVKICSSDSDKHNVGIATEIEIMKHIFDAPFAVKYFESLITDEYKVWISMELCEAGDLATLMYVCKKTLNRAQIEPIVAAVLLALQHLHDINIIHRDVKCANILLARNGVPKLSDFGISRKVRNHNVRAMSMAGSPYWMAPEVIKGRHLYNKKCDIWSLGISIYEMYYGDPPLTELKPREAIKVIITREHAETIGFKDDGDFNLALMCDQFLYPDIETRKTAEELLEDGIIKKVGKEMKALFDSKLLQSDDGGIQFGRRRGRKANPFSVLKPVRELVEECLPILERKQRKRHKQKKKIKRNLKAV